MSHQQPPNIVITQTRGRDWKWLIAAAALTVLSACGGGDDNPSATSDAVEDVGVAEVVEVVAPMTGSGTSSVPPDSANPTNTSGTTPPDESGVPAPMTGSGTSSVPPDSANPTNTSDTTQLDVSIDRNQAPLPDTGITASQCYQAGSNELVSCTSNGAIALNDKQDGMMGRDVSNLDSNDGKLGFSYSAVIGGCVKDNITGLTWEVKTADGGLRDGTKTYTNFGDNLASDSSTFVAAVNTEALCGYNDWRLPTVFELQSIMDYSVAYPGPTIDTTWFPNTQGSYMYMYWSSSRYADDAGIGWFVGFGVGKVYGSDRSSIGYVRLVR